MGRSPEELLQGVREPLRSIALKIIAESGGRIGVTGHGGFRSREQQAKMYQDYLNGGNLAAKPGHSMHERGLAIDFSGDLDLLAQIGPKYGLVNSVDGEPWHWTMGDDVDVQDDPNVRLPYDVGETENPEDALANRLNAVFSMMGGASPAGVTPAHQDDLLAPQSDPLEGTTPESSSAAGVAASGRSGDLHKYALSQFSKFGWGQEELNSLIELWNRESNWNPQADNPTSSAAGIAQKMTSIHGSIEPTPEGQINWGLQYIQGRYGSPSRALQFHNQNNWY